MGRWEGPALSASSGSLPPHGQLVLSDRLVMVCRHRAGLQVRLQPESGGLILIVVVPDPRLHLGSHPNRLAVRQGVHDLYLFSMSQLSVCPALL